MQKKTIAALLGLNVRSLNELARQRVYRIKSYTRKLHAIDLSAIPRDVRPRFFS